MHRKWAVLGLAAVLVVGCGLPGEGDTCSDNSMYNRGCAGDLICNAATDTCRRPGEVGDPCGFDEECEPELACDSVVKACVAAESEGAACHVDGACAAGLICAKGPGLSDAWGTCSPPSKDGEPCIWWSYVRWKNNGFGCAEGFSCVPQLPLPLGTTTRTDTSLPGVCRPAGTGTPGTLCLSSERCGSGMKCTDELSACVWDLDCDDRSDWPVCTPCQTGSWACNP